jgi:hypothetical protein
MGLEQVKSTVTSLSIFVFLPMTLLETFAFSHFYLGFSTQKRTRGNLMLRTEATGKPVKQTWNWFHPY